LTWEGVSSYIIRVTQGKGNTMNITTADLETGRTFCSGNTFYPTYNTVVRVVGYADLPARERKCWTVLGPQHHMADFAEQRYVLFRTGRRLGSLPVDVFVATHYTDADAMRAAYAEKNAE
jgi:hypothetical protein